MNNNNLPMKAKFLKKSLLITSAICLGLFSFSFQNIALAAEASKFGVWRSAKSSEKHSSRWTLEDWLAQKERNRMMDLWLAMYAPSPYEFYVGGVWQDHQKSTPSSTVVDRSTAASAKLGAYATVLGLSGEYRNNTMEKVSDLSGSINLRIAGNSVQGTHLIAFYGNRNRQLESQGTSVYLRNQYYGGDLNLYLNRYIGLSGLYTAYLPTDDKTLGNVRGDLTEYGLFIDFGDLRVSGSYFKETQKELLNSTETLTESKGSKVSLMLFF